MFQNPDPTAPADNPTPQPSTGWTPGTPDSPVGEPNPAPTSAPEPGPATPESTPTPTESGPAGDENQGGGMPPTSTPGM